MIQRKLFAGITVIGLVAGGSAVAVASTAPNHTTINAVTSLKVKINRPGRDPLAGRRLHRPVRWDDHDR
jgi:hypothetical protein